MSIEEKIKKSFENLKKDNEEIKNSIKMLSERLNSLENSQKAEKKINTPIFTSKPFINDDIKKAVENVFNSGIFSMGSKIKEFEDKFAYFCNAKHAIALANGTLAIEVVLKMLNIGNGDEVIVPSNTTMPTIEPVINAGAKPVFVDINENYLIDPDKIKNAITKKTKAIMPVHLYGNSADLDRIKEICRKNKIYLIEDCAQAHNTKYNGKHVGTFGIAGCFSFYPTKNLTVLGEGGMIITDDDELAKKCRRFISHGEEGRYNHVVVGTNYRLSEIHAAIGIKQLEVLNELTNRRKQIAKIYDEIFKDSNIIIPKKSEKSDHSYHLYVIRVNAEKRDKIINELKTHGIYCGIHYPVPCHKQKAVTDRFKTPLLPMTEKLAKEIISLPIYPLLKNEEAEFIGNKVKEVNQLL